MLETSLNLTFIYVQAPHLYLYTFAANEHVRAAYNKLVVFNAVFVAKYAFAVAAFQHIGHVDGLTDIALKKRDIFASSRAIWQSDRSENGWR
jgi:hypothetical protein